MTRCSRCGAPLRFYVLRCATCSQWQRPDRIKWAILGGLLGLLFLGGLGIRVATRRSVDASETISSAPEAGLLVTENATVPVAVDEPTCQELESNPAAKFGFGYARLLRANLVFEIPTGSKGMQIQENWTRVKVRVATADGDREGWVPRSWFRPGMLDWSPTVREGDQEAPTKR